MPKSPGRQEIGASTPEERQRSQVGRGEFTGGVENGGGKAGIRYEATRLAGLPREGAQGTGSHDRGRVQDTVV